jgi:hypothetical protein
MVGTLDHLSDEHDALDPCSVEPGREVARDVLASRIKVAGDRPGTAVAVGFGGDQALDEGPEPLARGVSRGRQIDL